MTPLSPEAIRTRAFIASFRQENGAPPAIHDIAQHLRVSVSQARGIINELIVAGYLQPGPNRTESAA